MFDDIEQWLIFNVLLRNLLFGGCLQYVYMTLYIDLAAPFSKQMPLALSKRYNSNIRNITYWLYLVSF